VEHPVQPLERTLLWPARQGLAQLQVPVQVRVHGRAQVQVQVQIQAQVQAERRAGTLVASSGWNQSIMPLSASIVTISSAPCGRSSAWKAFSRRSVSGSTSVPTCA
jgi:hypothetical protein